MRGSPQGRIGPRPCPHTNTQLGTTSLSHVPARGTGWAPPAPSGSSFWGPKYQGLDGAAGGFSIRNELKACSEQGAEPKGGRKTLPGSSTQPCPRSSSALGCAAALLAEGPNRCCLLMEAVSEQTL